jgi:hypothetical protein
VPWFKSAINVSERVFLSWNIFSHHTEKAASLIAESVILEEKDLHVSI